jgi:hypothetical protein
LTRKRHPLVEGLSAGADRADLKGMAVGIGEGLVRVSEAWLPNGKLAVPQHCPVPDCKAGPYNSIACLRQHLSSAHAGMTDRERSFVLDGARRNAVRSAMNGRAP